jgi:hypothetical protein
MFVNVSTASVNNIDADCLWKLMAMSSVPEFDTAYGKWSDEPMRDRFGTGTDMRMTICDERSPAVTLAFMLSSHQFGRKEPCNESISEAIRE